MSVIRSWERELAAIDRTAADLDAARVAHRPQPLDLAAGSIGEMLDTAPPPRVDIIRDWLPAGITGALVAHGGAGKTMALLQLAASVGAEIPYLGLGIETPGAVLMVLAEDDRPEIHRRLHRLVGRLRDGPDAPPDLDDRLRERLHILTRPGQDNLLTRRCPDSREVMATPYVETLIATADQIPNLRLLVLDPTSRFRGGEENSAEDTTRYVEQLERIRGATGATVLVAHHTTKAALAAPEMSQAAARGSSALVDGVRWVAGLWTLPRREAETYGLSPDEASRYLRLELSKSNYTPPWAGIWLERLAGGVLVPSSLAGAAGAARSSEGDAQYHAVLARVMGLIRQLTDRGQPTTRRAIRQYAGRAGTLRVGDHTVRAVISRALAEGDLLAVDSGGGEVIRVP